MDATLYTGTGNIAATQNNSDLGTAGFKPDLVWIKARSTIHYHALFDSVRGTGTNALSSNTTDSESGISSFANLTAFNTNGFSTGTTSSTNILNDSGQTFVAWQWQAGQGTTTTNNVGSISSQVSVNTAAGFSVVTYTGNGVTSTVGHGLGVAPSMIIIKERDVARPWPVYHSSIGATNYLNLSSTNASTASSAMFNNTSPTSNVFTVGTDTWTNNSGGTYVAYCWAQVAGFSQFGSYTGNGSADGPFIYTGFRPKYILIKKTSDVQSWVIDDASRSPYNVTTEYLLADTAGAAGNVTLYDFLSNGFKFRGTSQNDSGATFVYACFAENPFKYANAR
jgi:hypothetical protein